MPSTDYLVVKDKVQRYTKELFADVRIDDDGDLVIPYGSTAAYVSIIEKELDKESAAFHEKFDLPTILVNVFALVLREVKLSPELYEWVATEGQGYDFGSTKIEVMEESHGRLGHVIFNHRLAGNTLDAGELKNAVLVVCTTADEIDDELQKKFGGKRIEDLRD